MNESKLLDIVLPRCSIVPMERQHQIKRRLSQPDAIDMTRFRVSSLPMHRTRLAERLCQAFGFVEAHRLKSPA